MALGLALLLLLGGMWWLWPAAAVERVSGPMTAQAFVWQRAWGEDERAAIGAAADRFAGLLVLAGEIDMKRGQAAVGSPDYAALRAAGVSVGLVIRVEPWPGPFLASDPVVDVARSAVRRARAAGVEPSELLIDFDCGEKKLDGYAVWVDAVRAGLVADAERTVPVTITALPAWLDRGAFKRLARGADGYVLQVHSLQRPDTLDDPATLCAPEIARRWVEQAACLGHPFRVALPTYSYVLGFDPPAEGGSFYGIAAEGELHTLNPTKQWTLLRADPDALAGLVQAWSADRPMALKGVVWFRVPVAGDQLNWPWPTLDAVLAGRAPTRQLVAEARAAELGLVEIELVNTGEADLSYPERIRVDWPGDAPFVRDGLAGFTWADSRTLVAAEATRPWDRLAPGQRITIAWMRFAHDTEVNAHVQTTSP